MADAAPRVVQEEEQELERVIEEHQALGDVWEIMKKVYLVPLANVEVGVYVCSIKCSCILERVM